MLNYIIEILQTFANDPLFLAVESFLKFIATASAFIAVLYNISKYFFGNRVALWVATSFTILGLVLGGIYWSSLQAAAYRLNQSTLSCQTNDPKTGVSFSHSSTLRT
jgi:hypothetical protein